MHDEVNTTANNKIDSESAGLSSMVVVVIKRKVDLYLLIGRSTI